MGAGGARAGAPDDSRLGRARAGGGVRLCSERGQPVGATAGRRARWISHGGRRRQSAEEHHVLRYLIVDHRSHGLTVDLSAVGEAGLYAVYCNRMTDVQFMTTRFFLSFLTTFLSGFLPRTRTRRARGDKGQRQRKGQGERRRGGAPRARRDGSTCPIINRERERNWAPGSPMSRFTTNQNF